MITYEQIIDAQESVVKYWGEDGKRVIEETAKITPFNNDFKSFLKHCSCCGGNWGGMYLSGLKELYPNVWEAIPDNMGTFAWAGICNTLILCGIDCS